MVGLCTGVLNNEVVTSGTTNTQTALETQGIKGESKRNARKGAQPVPAEKPVGITSG